MKEHGIIVWKSSNVVTEFGVTHDGIFQKNDGIFQKKGEDGVWVRGDPAIGDVGYVIRT